MTKTVLQIPLKKDLRDKAAKMSEKMGFSSLQEAVRVLLVQMSEGNLQINFKEERTEKLSPRAESRYRKMIENIKTGKEPVYEFASYEDFKKHLESL